MKLSVMTLISSLTAKRLSISAHCPSLLRSRRASSRRLSVTTSSTGVFCRWPTHRRRHRYSTTPVFYVDNQSFTAACRMFFRLTFFSAYCPSHMNPPWPFTPGNGGYMRRCVETIIRICRLTSKPMPPLFESARRVGDSLYESTRHGLFPVV